MVQMHIFVDTSYCFNMCYAEYCVIYIFIQKKAIENAMLTEETEMKQIGMTLTYTIWNRWRLDCVVTTIKNKYGKPAMCMVI